MYLQRMSPRSRFVSLLLAVSMLAAACGSTDFDAVAPAGEAAQTDDGSDDGFDEVVLTSSSAGFFDASFVHDIDISFDDADYDEMIVTYETEGEKDWIEATVIVDGETFENAGVRLKGNSSLFSVTTETAGNPEALPWLIKLDKYVDDQNYQGLHDIVIRSNSTETAMNEAVAQELLALAGLANQDPVATSFTVNGGPTELRLAIEHPDEIWEDANFASAESALYKADSEGDYSYRGTDEEAYDDVFDQKVGDDDLDPLIDFLDFINNSDDTTFAAELGQRLDLESFADYLAFQDLVQNADDIDGRGNNSYLQYDYDTEMFTVVSWDLNLAFDTANVGRGDIGGNTAVGGDRGARGNRPERPAGDAAGGNGGGPGGGSNILASRFLADSTFAALYDQAMNELTTTFFTSGAAEAIVAEWVAVLSTDADQLVAASTIDAEAATITSKFPST